jgi:hypothetical protein
MSCSGKTGTARGANDFSRDVRKSLLRRVGASSRQVMNILKCAGNMSVAGLLATALAHPAAAESANAVLKDANGRDVRTVSLSQTPAGVLLKLSLKGMTPGRACLSHFVPWASASRPPSNRRVRTSTLAIRATAS